MNPYIVIISFKNHQYFPALFHQSSTNLVCFDILFYRKYQISYLSPINTSIYLSNRGLISFFCKGSHSKYFRLCRPHSLWQDYPTPKAATGTMDERPIFQEDLIYGHKFDIR